MWDRSAELQSESYSACFVVGDSFMDPPWGTCHWRSTVDNMVSKRDSSEEVERIRKRSRSVWATSIGAGLDTMSSLNAFFPFDGTCDCSHDADFTLTFDDESFLKISKCLLEMACPVFKAAIGECEHDGTLHLSDTSKDAWILILNFLHPAGRSDNYAQQIVYERLPTLVDVLRQCEKYGFIPLQQDLDRKIASLIYFWIHAILSIENPIPVIRQPERYLTVDVNLELFQTVRVFDLPQSEDALASYLISVLKENNSRMRERQKVRAPIDPRKISGAISRISEFLAQMRASGRYRMCSLLLQKMMDAQLCISLDLANVGGMAGGFT